MSRHKDNIYLDAKTGKLGIGVMVDAQELDELVADRNELLMAVQLALAWTDSDGRGITDPIRTKLLDAIKGKK